MIEFLDGMLVDKTPSQAVVQVGGVALGCMISLSTFDELPPREKPVKLWTRLMIRDEQPVLFGFATLRERWLFGHLITINGVGPKLAVTILSGAPVASIQEAIVSGDSARLKSVRGIGAKTADRIVLELQQKLAVEQPAEPGVTPDGKGDVLRQAIDALQALGIKSNEAEKAVAEAAKSGAADVEELIKHALRKG
jgi:Holliday junction DNA helicase RuvA